MTVFQSKSFLKDHIENIIQFYLPHVLDDEGGFYQNFYDDGTVFSEDKKHLVSSCRMVFNFCQVERLFQDPKYRSLWKHGLSYVRNVHQKPGREGYIWTLDSTGITDETNHAYGLAFVMLMYATTLKSGDEASLKDLYDTWDLLEKYFWDVEQSIYRDEISPDWKDVSSYRGQNANMHCCEALLFAYEATDDIKFLDRAYILARKITVDLAEQSNGLIWEHFDENLSIDWEYNRSDPKNLYRPWGFQPGHQTEWSKLLLLLHQFRPEEWMLEKAEDLFDRAVDCAWDRNMGGMFYGFAPDESICDDDKYFWVQAESLAAAALLAQKSGKQKYWDWYHKIWNYSWRYFVDHEQGAWFRVLSGSNQKVSSIKSEAGAKCDYHTIGACSLVYDLLP